MSQTALSIRLDSDIKPQFDAICREIGISSNAAFNIFARTVVRERALPFNVSVKKTGSDRRSARARIALQELQDSNREQWTDQQINDAIAEYRKTLRK